MTINTNTNKTKKSTDVVAITTSLPFILYNKQAKNELILITIYQNTVTLPTLPTATTECVIRENVLSA